MKTVFITTLATLLVLLFPGCGASDSGGGDLGTDVPNVVCTPDCGGRSCGDDGCGGSCGECTDGQVCNPVLGKCLGGCTADCTGKACGTNGCGGSCGDCGMDEDCFNGACAPKASCTDGARNGTETDVDCGGTCPKKCVVGKGCQGPADCQSAACSGGSCQPDLSCKDGAQNGDETDVDCGGSKCAPCAVTKFCKQHSDCLSEACVYGVCEKPTCDDNIKDQGEGDVDCGGPCPGKCPDGKTCKADGDCTSGTCANGICASCNDGKQDGPETDVDCGGGCKTCGDGKHCKKGSDCAGGGCEGGLCCAKNACGKCGPLPVETCNGLDDDCDGVTDNHLAAGAACPLQKGVCKGATQQCKGTAGWVCDASVYKAHNAKYEATESSCDGVDNNCDGQTDEGLKNKCGTCGAVPKEVCNGVDDDCDGQTDNAAMCGTCVATPTPVDLVSVDGGWGFQMSWKNFLAMLGDDAYVFVYNRGNNYQATPFFHLADGAEVGSPAILPISVVGNPYLWPGAGFLHLAVTGYNSGSVETQHQYYYQVSPAGQVLKQTEIDDSTNYSGAPSPVAQGGNTVGLVYWPASGGPQYTTMKSDGTWQAQGPVGGSGDYGLELALRKNGTAFIGTAAGSFGGPVSVEQVGGETYTVDSGTCSSEALRVAPDDTVWMVYTSGVTSSGNDGTIKAWTLKGSTASTPDTVGQGSSANLAFDPAGQAVVVYVATGGGSLQVARKSGGQWQAHAAYTAASGETLGGYTAIGIDSANRYHLAFMVTTQPVGGYNDLEHIEYVMYCPTDGGGVPDAGGGTVVTPTGCGDDPNNTCNGTCGQQGASGTCWCNSSCASYGDCCPDYAACCG